MAGKKRTEGLRETEERMLLLIAGFLDLRLKSPTVRELASLYGCSAPFALRMIQQLEDRGALYRSDGKITAINKVGPTRPRASLPEDRSLRQDRALRLDRD